MEGTDRGTGRSLLDEVRERGVIRIAAHWGNTVTQYLDPDSGEPAGMVGAVGRLLAQDLGVRAEFVDMPWADHVPALLAGRVDISLKHTNTPQRAFEVEFVDRYLIRDEGRALVRRDRGLRGEADLNQLGRIIALQRAASQEMHIRERYPLAERRVYPTTQDAFLAVAGGEADACLHDSGIPSFLRSHPECMVLEGADGRPATPYVDCVHPSIRPGDQRFLNWLNNWMAFREAGGAFASIMNEIESAFDGKIERILAPSSRSE